MRAKPLVYILICSCLPLTSTAFSAIASSDFFECTPAKIRFCVSENEQCDNIPVYSTDDETYTIKINLKKKLSETFAGANRLSETKIDRMKRLDQLLFLYGFEKHQDDKSDPHSWSAIIDLQSGHLTVTRISNGIGSVLNGVCHAGKGSEQ